MKKQKGMTLLGMLFIAAMVICVCLLAIQIIPVYLQFYEVQSSITALKSLPPSDFSDDPAVNGEILKTKLSNQLFINGIENLTRDQIILRQDEENQFNISLKYQVVRPLVWNISLLYNFTASEEIKIHGE